jgi:Lipocalin-like domain
MNGKKILYFLTVFSVLFTRKKIYLSKKPINMRKRSSFLPILAVCTLLILSCGKDNPDPVPAKTKTELITSSSWKFQSASAAGTDISSTSQLACFVDNEITFSSNLTGTINEATVVCSPSTAGPFTWSFQASETILQLSTALFPGGSSSFTIVSLNETNMVLSQNVVIPPSSSPIAVSVTFKH